MVQEIPTGIVACDRKARLDGCTKKWVYACYSMQVSCQLNHSFIPSWWSVVLHMNTLPWYIGHNNHEFLDSNNGIHDHKIWLREV